MENSAGSPSKPDPRQRAAIPLFRAMGPLMRLGLRRGLPAGPNVLLTVRGRVTGRPYSTPVAMWEFGNRRFVQASFGEVSWVRNLRASGEVVIRRGRWSQAMHAAELSPNAAGQLMHDALAGFRRPRLLRILLGPTVRPPAAILHRYRLRVDERLEDYVAEAGRHPLFELVPIGSATTTGPPP
jgi:deazaflavin-dependent oxidoreductase (nitroreductase family)